jgi:hypothetical protein
VGVHTGTVPERAGGAARAGGYRIVRRLGAGGMGTVFLAVDHRGRPVALKVLHEHLRHDPLFRRTFAREMDAARRVNGPGTARVLDADPNGKVPYLVTEYVEGMSLHELVAQHGPLGGPDVYAVAHGVAVALTTIHDSGVVHRDLKPRNVMLSPDGPKVIDFGVAGAVGRDTGVGMGTPGWLAPEQLAGHAGGTAADVYAWGLVVAWTATGTHPSHEPPDLTRLPPDLLPAVRGALAHDPADRPSAHDLVAVLCHAAAHDGATVNERPADGPTRWLAADGTTGWTVGNHPVKIDEAPRATRTTRPTRRPGKPSPRPASRRALAPHAAGTPVASGTPGAAAARGSHTPVAPRQLAPAARPRSRRRYLRRVTTALLVAGLLTAGWHYAGRYLPGSRAAATSTDRAGGGTPAATPTAAPKPKPNPVPTAPAPAPAGGPTVRDGGLAFTLTGMRCGDTDLGSWPTRKHANGQFCLVDVQVENVGDHTGFVFLGSQRLLDATGKEYPADDWSWVYYPQSRTFTSTIDAGTAVSGTMVFDTPPGVHFTQLVLHDTPLSRGTPLALP